MLTMVTGLEIIDTSIKMGLGAAITGIISYLATNRSQKHEMRKALITEKKDLLKESAMKFEKSSSIINRVNWSVSALAAKMSANREDALEILLDDLATAYNEGKEAQGS
jgi:2C-methyl-D-erythritol 2,4-cyclodiphosphate synthase